eukprot:1371773-Amorphochlora_amoeboformis.AAC.1
MRRHPPPHPPLQVSERSQRSRVRTIALVRETAKERERGEGGQNVESEGSFREREKACERKEESARSAKAVGAVNVISVMEHKN